MGRIVSNSSCIISLERMGSLNLLRRTFSEVLIPEAVFQEIGLNLDWITVVKVCNRELVQSLETQLGPGESEAIALAVENHLPIILDDQKARKLAQRLNVRVVGTLGMIIQAKRNGIIPNVKPIILKLKEVNLYLSQELIDQILQDADEF